MKKVLIAFLALVALVSNADDNSANAIITLLNSRASGSVKTYVEAAKEVEKGAKAGKSLHQYVLGVFSGDRVLSEALGLTKADAERYLSASREKILDLAEQKGNALAWYLLSIEKNDYSMLKRGADGNNVQALNAYGTYLLNEAIGSPSVSSNDFEKVARQCFTMFGKAAAMKDANGLFNIGTCYMRGIGCAKDMDLALDAFRSSAEMGHPGAINNLGGFYRDGVVVRKNPELAVKWFEKSAALGESYGELNLALAYQRGDGVERDLKKAGALLAKSAAQGNIEAMAAYGTCLYKGEGVDKNDAEAIKWFRASAREGFAPAMESLAYCYSKGIGVNKSDREALIWRIRARAASGDINAASWLKQNGHKLR